jgi:catalase
MRYDYNPGQPVYSPNSYSGPVADEAKAGEIPWHVDGDLVRSAYSLHAEDDDFGQPGTLVREVLDQSGRDHLAHNVIGHLKGGVSATVLERAVAYWRAVDKALGDKIASAAGVV